MWTHQRSTEFSLKGVPVAKAGLIKAVTEATEHWIITQHLRNYPWAHTVVNKQGRKERRWIPLSKSYSSRRIKANSPHALPTSVWTRDSGLFPKNVICKKKRWDFTTKKSGKQQGRFTSPHKHTGHLCSWRAARGGASCFFLELSNHKKKIWYPQIRAFFYQRPTQLNA